MTRYKKLNIDYATNLWLWFWALAIIWMFFGLLPFNTLDYIFIAILILVFMEAIFLVSVNCNKKHLENTGLAHTIYYKWNSLLAAGFISPILIYTIKTWDFTWKDLGYTSLVIINGIFWILIVIVCIVIAIFAVYLYIKLNNYVKDYIVRRK
jgi:hypothetical protein